MAKLKIKLTGGGTIDNCVIYLEDPAEKIPYHFIPRNDTTWELENVSIPIEGPLDYSLHVLAFSGTGFSCTISNENGKKITLEGLTGTKVKNKAHVFGTQNFS